MAQFDVYINPDPGTKRAIPYLLDVQTDLLDNLATRVVTPLISRESMGKAAQHLNPQFTIQRIDVIMSSAELVGVMANRLGERVCSLREHRNEIVAALVFLIAGL
jgi:toxin CcdB